jgi:MOSC domain-containing protein YiiM
MVALKNLLHYYDGVVRSEIKLISVNVGLPREVVWKGETVLTGIFKEPVEGPVMLRKLNLEGDRQADLSVHGGVSKAVYAYPSEHYEFWRSEFPDMKLPWGMFGENLTTEGLLEEWVQIGDRFRIGAAEVIATEPRLPCFKLGVKFRRAEIIKRFLLSRRTGVYFAVIKEGRVAAGDRVEPVYRDKHGVTIADITRLYAFERDDLEMLQRAVQVKTLPEKWRRRFQHQIEEQAKIAAAPPA